MSAGRQAVENFLAGLPVEERAVLEQIRGWVRAACPEGQEKISYGMPTFNYKGRYLIGYAAFKAHYGLYPGSEALAALDEKWARYRKAKGTLQVPKSEAVPQGLVRDVTALRMRQIEAR